MVAGYPQFLYVVCVEFDLSCYELHLGQKCVRQLRIKRIYMVIIKS